ncbi:TrbI/VirB10 family protein [Ruegeria sp.]|uniref:TrbI/VirB10 family protein n=1 Tax=Ruegeria sp. TaxID=1879320 RepID=UPI003B001461
MHAFLHLAIRAKPRPVRRFNRKALIALCGATGIFILSAAVIAFRDDDGSNAGASPELYKTNRNNLPEQITAMPADYSQVKPKLGPPLPGDLGPAFLGQPSSVETPQDNPFRYQGAPTQTVAQPAPVDAALGSSLFFVRNIDQRALRTAQSVSQTFTPSLDQFSALPLTIPPQSGNQSQGAADPNRQDRKEAFISRDVETGIYNPNRLQTPMSPYQVMAGTIIPASLVTGLNSDLPGQVIAQVTQNVYDTTSGQHLLIPQGSRLIGQYDSVIAFGQSRALVTWRRIIRPDGTSLVLENLPGTDLSGFAGLKDRVDNHTLRLFGAAVLSTVLSVGSELGRDSNEDDIIKAIRDGGQRTLNQAGQRIVNRQLNVQPTIKVRPGWRLNVIVNKDLVLQPYQG